VVLVVVDAPVEADWLKTPSPVSSSARATMDATPSAMRYVLPLDDILPPPGFPPEIGALRNLPVSIQRPLVRAEV
jgi:hypothetical protein